MANQIIAVDVGFGHVKIAKDGLKTSFPSLVAPASSLEASPFGLGFQYQPYEKFSLFDEGSNRWDAFYVGNPAENEQRGDLFDDRTPNWVTKTPYEVMLVAALLKANMSDQEPINLVLDLPISSMKQFRKELEQKYTNRKIRVKTLEFERNYQIAQCLVIPQGFAAMYAAIPAQQLQSGIFGIVEIGANTTDFTVMNDMTISERGTGSIDIGILKVIDLFQQEVENAGQKYTQAKLDRLLPKYVETSKMTVPIRLQEKDMTVEFKRILDSVTNSIWGQVSKRLGDYRFFQALVFAGGGSHLTYPILEPQLKDDVYTVLPKDPQFANAEGALFIGKQRLAN